jgi:hypothetical protein
MATDSHRATMLKHLARRELMSDLRRMEYFIQFTLLTATRRLKAHG